MESLQQPLPQVAGSLHERVWENTVTAPAGRPLAEDLQTEVVIIGGGIAGVSIAYQLATVGIRTVLLEKGALGSGETGRTTAHLTVALDDRYYEIERIFGKEKARLAADSHRTAIDYIETVCNTENIAAAFERLPGYLFLHPTDDLHSLKKEYDAAIAAGLPVKFVDLVPGIKPTHQAGIEFMHQATFHPLKYLLGLADAATRKGALLFTHTHVQAIHAEGVVTDKGFRVHARYVVVATNSPVNDKFTMHLKQFAFRTYVIGLRMAKGSLPKALWWDTGDQQADSQIPPYHYVRTAPYDDIYDVLIVGGEDHATGLAFENKEPGPDRYQALETWARRHFPEAGEVIYRWSGQVLEPMDGLAFIGHNPGDKDNIFIVTGDSGNGMTHGTIAGLLIPDLIQGKENKWASLYDPARVKFFKSGRTWIKEFVGGFIEYLKEYPHEADKVKVSAIGVGEGRIIEVGKHKYGVFRDEDNELHVVSAACTHLGCLVKWNPDEQSWDCPCHGSRFSYRGKVLNGPANKDLAYYKEKLPDPDAT
ncbi:(2Fe-2S)-binding protein [Chitinophaga parva]|uniref:(2Fe-2S)-binding protein n=1 Tax=Chitinophaga parva TaxID=2169414 RepID=A0A2T7BL56_9BACT|nr:FAD-dependent oxidoreductase [Chitinophaga parva]PUZ28414.1 (2Fe-2S)-binding protein [Chitinophaga parva]